MIEQFQSIITALIRPGGDWQPLPTVDLAAQLDWQPGGDARIARVLNAAFIITLAGSRHPAFGRAKGLLGQMADSPEWADVAGFYLNGTDLIRRELETACKRDARFADRLEALADWASNNENLGSSDQDAERVWSVFFPEATGIRSNRRQRVEALREKRTVTITQLNAAPITDPARQVLFTSNVLLTVPAASKSRDALSLSDELKEELAAGSGEPQLYWYDHPIPLGIEPEKNEILHGLRGLDAAARFERARGNMPRDAKLTCVLSVSVTHRSLQAIARRYLQEQLARCDSLDCLEVYALTESDARRLIDEILVPAAGHYLQRDDAEEFLGIFGVDGNYGRHYSFLKAIAPLWSIFIQPEKRATFKIDLDQVFPQEELVEQTGNSAFEHFTTPLWGARGVDSDGQPLELGMIVGAMVNERDIGQSLFTPDVPFPSGPLGPDQSVFFSALPQALSTEAEMMTRYGGDRLDGKRTCIQRIHVLGGINGILIDSLRRHRPFTPSFIGRAEDQAYILSVLSTPGRRLAYVHEDGLIMRHDKRAFAQEAIRSAGVGKLIGDYIRILYFSAYAGALTGDVEKLKDAIDPFTGCFVSGIPTTVVYLRFALKAASLFAEGKFAEGNDEQGLEFVTMGSRRIAGALDFIRGQNNRLKQCYEKERLGWDLYYDTLRAVEDALSSNDDFALELRERAQRLIRQCRVRAGPC